MLLLKFQLQIPAMNKVVTFMHEMPKLSSTIVFFLNLCIETVIPCYEILYGTHISIYINKIFLP